MTDGTLHLSEAEDYQALAHHCSQLGLLPSPPPTQLEDPHWVHAGSLTPTLLHRYRDAALPYTCFVEPAAPPSGPPTITARGLEYLCRCSDANPSRSTFKNHKC